eukprot:gene7078-biopygen6279
MEPFVVFEQAGLDVVIEEELREHVQLLLQKLIHEIHSRVHDPRPMGANRVGDVRDVYSVKVFRLRRPRALDEYLVVEVVRIPADEEVDLPRHLEDVQPLVEGLAREARLGQVHIVPLLRERPHLLVRLPILRLDCGEVVELRLQVVLHEVPNAEPLAEETQRGEVE